MIDTDYYYTDLAAAYVRGSLPECRHESDLERLFSAAGEQGLKLHRFKQSKSLPRVRTVLGVLQGIQPGRLLDIGSGRGVFLWPLLDAFPSMPVVSVDRAQHRITHIAALNRGGIGRLSACTMDAAHLGFPNRCFDVVTILEVLEHLAHPEAVVGEALRVSKGFVIASVPSKEDDNPEHVRLFTDTSFTGIFRDAGATQVKVDHVLNHMVCIARV